MRQVNTGSKATNARNVIRTETIYSSQWSLVKTKTDDKRKRLYKVRDEIVPELLDIRDRLGRSEMWKTYHEMDGVIKRIGWELSELLEKLRRSDE